MEWKDFISVDFSNLSTEQINKIINSALIEAAKFYGFVSVKEIPADSTYIVPNDVVKYRIIGNDFEAYGNVIEARENLKIYEFRVPVSIEVASARFKELFSAIVNYEVLKMKLDYLQLSTNSTILGSEAKPTQASQYQHLLEEFKEKILNLTKSYSRVVYTAKLEWTSEAEVKNFEI